MLIQAIKTSVMKFVKDEDGLTIVEYAVAGGLITLGAVVAFVALGDTVCGVINGIDQALNDANDTGVIVAC
jgi:pilus assembly protein Flp/PilA